MLSINSTLSVVLQPERSGKVGKNAGISRSDRNGAESRLDHFASSLCFVISGDAWCFWAHIKTPGGVIP